MEYIVIFGHDRSETKLRHQPTGERINNRQVSPPYRANLDSVWRWLKSILEKNNCVRFSVARELRGFFIPAINLEKNAYSHARLSADLLFCFEFLMRKHRARIAPASRPHRGRSRAPCSHRSRARRKITRTKKEKTSMDRIYPPRLR